MLISDYIHIGLISLTSLTAFGFTDYYIRRKIEKENKNNTPNDDSSSMKVNFPMLGINLGMSALLFGLSMSVKNKITSYTLLVVSVLTGIFSFIGNIEKMGNGIRVILIVGTLGGMIVLYESDKVKNYFSSRFSSKTKV